MSRTLAFKAEVVFALQLILRHRAPRLALVLVACLVMFLLAGGAAEVSLGARERTVVLIAGALAAVGASRLLAAGAPLSSVRLTASPWWLAPTGRLLAATLFAALPVLAAALVVIGGQSGPLPAVRLVGKLTAYVAATAAGVMAVTPLMGASAAGSLGLMAALFGGISPSEVAAALGSWPLARGAALVAWNSLPLAWRAVRWVGDGGSADPVVLACWTLLGLAASALVAGPPGRHGNSSAP